MSLLFVLSKTMSELPQSSEGANEYLRVVDVAKGEVVPIIIDEDDYVYLDERSYQRDVYLYFENLRLKREAKVIYDKLVKNNK